MAHWVRSLKSFVASRPVPEDPEPLREAKINSEVASVLRRRKAASEGCGAGGGATSDVIPRFFFKRRENTLAKKFEASARQQALRKKINELPSEEDLAALKEQLDLHAPDGRVDYDQFCIIRDALSDQLVPFFKASLFVKLSPDARDTIDASIFWRYVQQKVVLQKTRIQLALQDADGTGFLKEIDLENFIFNVIPELPALKGLQESFHPFYVFHAVRKFMFFLPCNNGAVSIKNIIGSRVLAELLELKKEDWGEADNRRNWFSGAKALNVYSTYINLDMDHNGMLSKAEISRFGRGSLTSVVVHRLFEEFNTYSGEMDYKTFLDFILAMENKRTKQSVAYFFRVLDISHKGFLTRFNINFFFREIMARMPNQEPVAVADDEIYDMVKPKDGIHITLQDLVKSGVGHTVAHMLTDVNGFWKYDNRESLMHEEDDEEE